MLGPEGQRLLRRVHDSAQALRLLLLVRRVDHLESMLAQLQSFLLLDEVLVRVQIEVLMEVPALELQVTDVRSNIGILRHFSGIEL